MNETEKYAKVTIGCKFIFTEGQDVDGFSPYDLVRQWAHQHVNVADKDTTIWLEDEALIDSEPWVPLKQVVIKKPFQEEPYASTPEDEEQYRMEATRKVSQSNFVRYLLKRLGVTYELITPDA